MLLPYPRLEIKLLGLAALHTLIKGVLQSFDFRKSNHRGRHYSRSQNKRGALFPDCERI